MDWVPAMWFPEVPELKFKGSQADSVLVIIMVAAVPLDTD